MNLRGLAAAAASVSLVCGLATLLFLAKRDPNNIRIGYRVPYLLTSEDISSVTAAKSAAGFFRTGKSNLILLDLDGSPLPEGVRVDYKLVRHAFGIGASDKLYPQLEAARAPLQVNTQTTLSFWNGVVADSDISRYDFSQSERFYARSYRAALGDTLVYHAALWTIHGKKDADRVEGWVPIPVTKLETFEQQRAAVLRHVAAVARYTKGRYHVVNLYNEPLNKWSNSFGWSVAQSLQIIEESARLFRSINPDTLIMLNLGSGIWNFAQRVQVPDLLRILKMRRVPVDRIGLQLWSNGLFEWNALADERMSASLLSRRLREFAAFGIPIAITEFAVPARGPSGPFGEWTERRQADFAEAVFWIAYGTPGIESFTYFSTADRFILHSGLLDPSGNPRPVWHRLKQAIDSLTTAGSARLDSRGSLRLSGTAGEYLLTAPLPGNRTLHYRARISPRESLTASLVPVAPRSPAPEPYRSLSSHLTAGMVLTGSIATIPPSAKPLTPSSVLRAAPAWFQLYSGKPRNASVEANGSWSVDFDSGVALTGFPTGISVSFDVDIDSHRPLGYLVIVAGTKRMHFEDVPPGRHRVTFDPSGASEATLIFSRKLGAPTGRARLLGWALRR
jgi:GH35 family endo-1,4-beta-xylanase